MAIDIDVRNDKFPYLARQIQGNVAKAFGLGIDHVYETDQEFLYFLSNFSIDNLDGKWLDMLGVILGMPRPYSTRPVLDNLFEFDNTKFLLDPKKHGLSTIIPIIIDGVAYDRSDGGVLDSIYFSDEQTPVNDNIYKMYLKATSLLKKTHSIIDISNVLELFMDSTRYAILFRNATGYVNDIQIILSATSADYKDALQTAFNKIFTIPPYVLVTVALDFDNVYTIPVIESIIEDVTGEDSRYTVVFSFENKKAVFTITLDSSLAQYENEIRIALESHFAGANDVVIVIEDTFVPVTKEFAGTEIYSFAPETEVSYTITTASTGITSSTMPILVGDTYINTTTQDVWICSTAGTPTTAKWKYQGRRCSDKDDSNRFRMFTPATDYGLSVSTITKSVVKGENPFGKIDDLLKITNTNGIANSSYIPYKIKIKIDPKKTYRHVTYIKQEDANYTEYIGIEQWEVENSFCLSLDGSTINSAYFTGSNNFGTLGRWYMVVGYIVANGTTTAPADAGVYDMVTKQKVRTVTNYQWKPNVTYCDNSGCLIRYTSSDSTKTGTAYLYDIRLDEVNGTEPSLNELLNLDTTTKCKGIWNASTVYNIGDIVYLNGNSYICTVNHTSGTYFDSTKWNIIASKGDTGP